jgi:hypothetical protein
MLKVAVRPVDDLLMPSCGSSDGLAVQVAAAALMAARVAMLVYERLTRRKS